MYSPQVNTLYILEISDEIDDNEELSAIQIGSIISEMEIYAQEYVNGWEILG